MTTATWVCILQFSIPTRDGRWRVTLSFLIQGWLLILCSISSVLRVARCDHIEYRRGAEPQSGYPAGANEVFRRSVQWDELAVLLFAIGGEKLAPKALGLGIYIDLIGLYKRI